MEGLILLLSILGSDLFFTLSALIGLEYLGIENSPVYLLYTIIVFFITIGLPIRKSIILGDRYTLKNASPLFIPYILTIIFLITILLNKSSAFAIRYYFLFLILGMPAIFTGMYVAYKKKLSSLDKLIGVIMIIFTLSVFIAAISSLSKGLNFTSLGGATYQTASYLGAFSYGLNLYCIFIQSEKNQLFFQKSNIYKKISYLFLPLQVLSVLITGGRGGMVLIAFYTLFFLINLRKNHNYQNLFKFLFVILILFLTFLFILPILLKIESFNSAFLRVFSYITESGIDWTQTSNRDLAYYVSLDLIKKAPIFGYGYFGMWKITGYPHNIFLEVLQQGGFTYLIFVLIFIALLVTKVSKMIRFQKSNELIWVLALYPGTMLLFSGTYQINAMLWFIISYIMSYKIDDKVSS